jgi:hypothetical protein
MAGFGRGVDISKARDLGAQRQRIQRQAGKLFLWFPDTDGYQSTSCFLVILVSRSANPVLASERRGHVTRIANHRLNFRAAAATPESGDSLTWPPSLISAPKLLHTLYSQWYELLSI